MFVAEMYFLARPMSNCRLNRATMGFCRKAKPWLRPGLIEDGGWKIEE